VGTVVVYVHGLWLWGGESFLLRRRLARALDAECRFFSYPSVSAGIDDNAAALGKYLRGIRADRLHLVAHSMGGLVILRLFEHWSRLAPGSPELPPGRIVLAGSPVRGSRTAERLAGLPLGRALLGRSAAEVLLEHGERRWAGGREVGVITGERAVGLGRLFGPMDGANDGTVWAEETGLAGATDQVRLRVSHSGMVFSPLVATQIAAFLRDGRFEGTSNAHRFESLYAQALEAAAAGDIERAVELYDQALVLAPMHAEAHYKRGNALKDIGRREAAILSYGQAIKYKPDYAHAHCNLGVVQQALGLAAEAQSSYDRAIAIDPSDAMAHYNRALLMQDCSRWAEAVENYDRAISINPEFAEAQYNRAMALLFLGDFERGWRSYEWRWKNAQRLDIGEPRHFAQPLWLGEDSLVGKRLLLHCEAGLGDTLQFCRYAPLVAAMGATVYLEVPQPLLRILANLGDVAQVIPKGNALPEFDYHCPLMSLPLAFKTTLQTIPNASKYLNSDRTRAAQRREVLQDRGNPRIGLAWSGNPKNTIDSRRCVRLAEWIPHLPAEFAYFSLQKDVREEDRATLASNPFITPFDSAQDFVDTAALCECMDVVVCVDTSVAHLSAALGRRTWILLPFSPDWRWMRERSDSPWYPTAKLYRQKTAGDWGEVLARVGSDLRREFPAGGSTPVTAISIGGAAIQ
jgi:tetratricopeptide (TPR) repeat protein